MSLRAAHALVLALSLSLALLCVLMGNVLPDACWWSLAVPWLSAAMSQRSIACPTWAGSLIALAAFAWAARGLIAQGLDAAMVAACIALVGICVARLLTRQTPSHDLHSLVLSLLLVFAGTVLQQQFSYGLILVGYTIAVTWALVTRQLIHGAALQAYRTADAAAHAATLARRDVVTPLFFAATAGVALVILLGTGVLFVAFPRVGLGGFGFGQHHGSQFPGDVSLAGPPRASGDDTVVARLWGIGYGDFARGLYLRGRIYDTAGLAGFTQSPSLLDMMPSRLALAPPAPPAVPTAYEVYLQPVAEQVLLALGPVLKADPGPGAFASPAALERIGFGPAGELVSLDALTGPVRYRVRGTLVRVPPPAASSETALAGTETLAFDDAKFVHHFLALPADLDARVVPLAQSIVGDATSFAGKATRLRSYLLRHFVYSLTQDNGAQKDPLASFLFDDRRGHCEYFASAFAILLRAVGVPSRVVGGFQGGAWDPEGPTVIFTSNNAHAWVEWYAPQRGWRADDATPFREATTLSGAAAWLERARRIWDDQIVDFGLDQQLAMVRGIVSAVHPARLRGIDAWAPARLPWRRVGVCAGIGSAGVALWFGARAHLRRRRHRRTGLSPLATSLMQVLTRLHGADIAANVTLREAVYSVMPQLAAPQQQQLYLALTTYERWRFAACAPSAKTMEQLQRTLKALRAPRPKASAPPAP